MITITFRDLIAEWQAAYETFLAAVHALPADKRETPGICGVWNARQVVAHLAGWHYEAVRRYAEIAVGDPLNRQYDEDSFNALQVEARAHLTWEQTLDDLREVTDILRAQARELTEQQAVAEPRYAEWLRGLTGDLRHHTEQVRAWLPPGAR